MFLIVGGSKAKQVAVRNSDGSCGLTEHQKVRDKPTQSCSELDFVLSFSPPRNLFDWACTLPTMQCFLTIFADPVVYAVYHGTLLSSCSSCPRIVD